MYKEKMIKMRMSKTQKVNVIEVKKVKIPKSTIVKMKMIENSRNQVRSLRRIYKRDLEFQKKDIVEFAKRMEENKKEIKEMETYLKKRHKRLKIEDIDKMIGVIKEMPEVNCVKLDYQEQRIGTSGILESHTLYIHTNDIIMNNPELDIDTNIGKYIIEINLNDLQSSGVTITNPKIRKYNELNNQAFQQHPHINNYGNSCLGNAIEFFVHLKKMEIDKFTFGMVEFLKGFTNGNAYCQYYTFVNYLKFVNKYYNKKIIEKYSFTAYQDLIYSFFRNGIMREKEFSLTEIEKRIIKEIEEKNERTNRYREENGFDRIEFGINEEDEEDEDGES